MRTGTSKVARITEELCGFEVSSTQVSRCAALLDEELEAWRCRPLGAYAYVVLDARYESVRQGGQVLDAAVLLALGVRADGKREILGVSSKLSEAEVHWSICGFSKAIYDTYNGELSACLLNLAISIRVSLGSDPEYDRRDSGIRNSGLFEGAGPHEDGTFSIKDVCDKLIHAQSITKPIERGAQGSCCKLIGSHRGKMWELDLGVRIFSEYVLKWLDDIDARAAA